MTLFQTLRSCPAYLLDQFYHEYLDDESEQNILWYWSATPWWFTFFNSYFHYHLTVRRGRRLLCIKTADVIMPSYGLNLATATFGFLGNGILRSRLEFQKSRSLSISC